MILYTNFELEILSCMTLFTIKTATWIVAALHYEYQRRQEKTPQRIALDP